MKALLQRGAELHHEPANAIAWLNLGFAGGGTVAGQEYGETACYERALHHEPANAEAWFDLGCAGGGTVAGQEYSQTGGQGWPAHLARMARGWPADGRQMAASVWGASFGRLGGQRQKKTS